MQIGIRILASETIRLTLAIVQEKIGCLVAYAAHGANSPHSAANLKRH